MHQRNYFWVNWWLQLSGKLNFPMPHKLIMLWERTYFFRTHYWKIFSPILSFSHNKANIKAKFFAFLRTTLSEFSFISAECCHENNLVIFNNFLTLPFLKKSSLKTFKCFNFIKYTPPKKYHNCWVKIFYV